METDRYTRMKSSPPGVGESSAQTVWLGLLTFGFVSLVAIGVVAFTFSIQSRNTLTELRTEIDTLTSWVDGNATQVGEVKLWTDPNVPEGWLLCDGSEVSRETYATLFSVIGITWGEGDASTTFTLPDFRGRSPVGAGVGTYYEAGMGHAVDDPLVNKTLGEMGGALYPSGHVGDQAAAEESSIQDQYLAAAGIYSEELVTIGFLASNEEGGNYHPYTTVNFIIKY